MNRTAKEHRLLIVDDEEQNLRILERLLRTAGYEHIRTTADPRLALPQFREFEPDLLLLDLSMPYLDGFAVMKQVASRVPDGAYFPVLIITGHLEPEVKQKALLSGAKDFLTKPFDPVEVVLRVRNLLDTRDMAMRLEARVQERTEELRIAELGVADRLAMAAELRDYPTGQHTRRVGRTAARIAEQLGMPAAEVELLRRAAPLHDIGKIGIPESILLKPASLSLEEMDLIKTHTTLGARILSGSHSAVLQMAEEIALYHHENWDGTGYTPGLAGESIPLVGRIVAVADVFDALSHERPYREAWSVERSAAWIEQQSGTKFDPTVVDAFLRAAPTEDLPLLDDPNDALELELPNLFSESFRPRDTDAESDA